MSNSDTSTARQFAGSDRASADSAAGCNGSFVALPPEAGCSACRAAMIRSQDRKARGLALGGQAEEEEMTDHYYWPASDGHRITMFLEEAGLDYTSVAAEL